MTNPNDPALTPVWEAMGISHRDLGCVMLDLDLLTDRPQWQAALTEMEADAYIPEPPSLAPWVEGIEKRHHVTLLYGLTIDPSRYPEEVETLLRHSGSLDRLEQYGVRLSSIEVFDSNIPGVDYACIVLRSHSNYLVQANAALKMLPHVDTWPDYKPHVTLGYVQKRTAPYWQQRLTEILSNGLEVPVTGLNLGKEKPWLTKN